MKQYRINNQIVSRNVSLVGHDGKSLGEKDIRDALLLARDEGLDLVEIVPQNNGTLPVCKILDYGQFKYLQNKKERQVSKNQIKELSEIRFGLNIADHDLDIKISKVLELLKEKSKKVKVTIRLKGRERQNGVEKAMSILKSVYGKVQECNGCKLEKPPIAEGASIFMILRRE